MPIPLSECGRHVIVVGKNVNKCKPGRPPNRRRDAEKMMREAKLAKWFSDTELSGQSHFLSTF